MDQLHSDSDAMAAGLEGDVENEDRITKINICLQGLFGAQFEILIEKLHGNAMYFVVFCNLINILDQHFSCSPKRQQWHHAKKACCYIFGFYTFYSNLWSES
jgi:hypothetical protein